MYRVICVVKETSPHSADCMHIRSIGTGPFLRDCTKRWTLEEVLAAMGAGSSFYTQSNATLKITEVEKYTCDKCQTVQIRSAAGALKDSDLQALPKCCEGEELTSADN